MTSVVLLSQLAVVNPGSTVVVAEVKLCTYVVTDGISANGGHAQLDIFERRGNPAGL